MEPGSKEYGMKKMVVKVMINKKTRYLQRNWKYNKLKYLDTWEVRLQRCEVEVKTRITMVTEALNNNKKLYFCNSIIWISDEDWWRALYGKSYYTDVNHGIWKEERDRVNIQAYYKRIWRKVEGTTWVDRTSIKNFLHQ